MIALAMYLAAAAPLSQAHAVALAQDAMRQIDPTTPIICLIFDVDKTTRQRFDLTVRELHDYKCGGDDTTSPVRERFHVARSPVTISRLDPVDDRYVTCKVAKAVVTCPATSTATTPK